MWPTVPGDRPCKFCGYNLRMLPFSHRCPECGRFVYETVRFLLRLSPSTSTQPTESQKRLLAAIETVADETGHPIRAVRFVICAIHFAKLRMERSLEALDARGICRAVKDYALIHFGGENNAIIELAQHKIRASEDVGEIIYGLVRAKVFHESEGDSIKDFAGLFTLDNLFSATFANVNGK